MKNSFRDIPNIPNLAAFVKMPVQGIQSDKYIKQYLKILIQGKYLQYLNWIFKYFQNISVLKEEC